MLLHTSPTTDTTADIRVFSQCLAYLRQLDVYNRDELLNFNCHIKIIMYDIYNTCKEQRATPSCGLVTTDELLDKATSAFHLMANEDDLKIVNSVCHFQKLLPEQDLEAINSLTQITASLDYVTDLSNRIKTLFSETLTDERIEQTSMPSIIKQLNEIKLTFARIKPDDPSQALALSLSKLYIDDEIIANLDDIRKHACDADEETLLDDFIEAGKQIQAQGNINHYDDGLIEQLRSVAQYLIQPQEKLPTSVTESIPLTELEFRQALQALYIQGDPKPLQTYFYKRPIEASLIGAELPNLTKMAKAFNIRQLAQPRPWILDSKVSEFSSIQDRLWQNIPEDLEAFTETWDSINQLLGKIKLLDKKFKTLQKFGNHLFATKLPLTQTERERHDKIIALMEHFANITENAKMLYIYNLPMKRQEAFIDTIMAAYITIRDYQPRNAEHSNDFLMQRQQYFPDEESLGKFAEPRVAKYITDYHRVLSFERRVNKAWSRCEMHCRHLDTKRNTVPATTKARIANNKHYKAEMDKVFKTTKNNLHLKDLDPSALTNELQHHATQMVELEENGDVISRFKEVIARGIEMLIQAVSGLQVSLTLKGAMNTAVQTSLRSL